MNAHIERAEKIAKLMDEAFEVFGFKFGFDSILGLIPGAGDTITFLISLYLVWIGYQMKLPQSVLNTMIAYTVIDFLIGTIPVLGDIADFFYKANTKNLEILKAHQPKDK